jgi:two-component system sensor histidine kinase PilS (NtrC family)
VSVPSLPAHSHWSWGADNPAEPETPTFYRLWRGFMTARVGVAFILMVLLGAQMALGLVPAVGAGPVALCGAYLLASLAARLFTRPNSPGPSFDPQWVFNIGLDLVALSALHVLQAGGLNYSPAFALPVLMASVLGSMLLALGTAAAVTLLLLADAWLAALQQPGELAARFLQAGLTGTGYFAVAVLANQLAARLAREELSARRSQLAARTQAQVNELVIESLADGVLVVGPDFRVHAANPAARELLGWRAREAPASLALSSRPGWQPLVELALRTFVERLPQSAEVALGSSPDERLVVQVRTRLTPLQEAQSDTLCVMFLEDLREVEARLRTEKLAAMGRMSAAVAHEIRNPLAAIAQANALLGEELGEPGQRQLSALVQQNTHRLAHIVDEILNLARVQQQERSPAWLALDESVRSVCTDWAQHMNAGGRLQLALAAGGERVVFESEHLRRVLVNLLDNALRYASESGAAIRVSTDAGGTEARLRVWSDGAPLEQGVQRHLFEPFFSSESRSTGLGLYICRELCDRHGASITYRRTTPQEGGPGNEFVVTMRSQPPHRVAPAVFDTIRA